jgi:hypothetical protein
MGSFNDSLDFKLKIAQYHRDKCFEAVDRPRLFDSNESRLIAVSAEFTAMMLTFQSSIDIVGQLINDKRNLDFSKDRMYFSWIMERDFFDSTDKLEGLKELLLKLNHEKKYIFDYCNTIKHQNLIYLQEESSFVSMYQSVQYYCIKSFRHHKEKIINDILFGSYNTLQENITKIMSKV